MILETINWVYAQVSYDFRETLIKAVSLGEENHEQNSLEIQGNFVQKILINEELDLLWVYNSPKVYVLKLSTFESIRVFDPYQWINSSYLIFNSVSISSKGNIAAISYGNKIRLC